MTSRHVLVLSGGLSPERDVSLRSGRRVADALKDVRPDWHVAEADVDAALLPYLQENRPDCIVPLLHGAAGEDGALRDLLETLDAKGLGLKYLSHTSDINSVQENVLPKPQRLGARIFRS